MAGEARVYMGAAQGGSSSWWDGGLVVDKTCTTIDVGQSVHINTHHTPYMMYVVLYTGTGQLVLAAILSPL